MRESAILDPLIPSTEQLQRELADARLLHRLSIELIQEDGTAGLYKKIVEAAVAIMRSQYASMQMLYPDGEGAGKLRLLASSGFSPEAEKFWEWVYRHTGSSCGAALRAQSRVVIPNFETCEFMQSAPTLPMIAVIVIWGGINFAIGTAVQTRILRWTADAPNLASSLIPSGFNIGIAIAASVGATMLNAGLSYRSLPLVGVAAMMVAIVAAGLSHGAERRNGERPPLQATSG